MKRWATVSLFFLVLLGPLPRVFPEVSCCEAFAAEKTLAQMEADYEREQNPRRRVNLAVAISDENLKNMLSAYQAGDTEKETEETNHYLSAVDRLEKAINADSVKGAFKDAEIHLRRQTRALENLRTSLSLSEQQSVDKAISRANKLHEQILYSVMNLQKHG